MIYDLLTFLIGLGVVIAIANIIFWGAIWVITEVFYRN
jgi:hypothetical protein